MRNQTLDIVRGISVLLVVLFHYTARIPQEHMNADTELAFTFDGGWVGVFIFFVISGICISETLSRSFNAPQFMAKRISRIYPPFVVSVALACLVILIFNVPEYHTSTGEFETLSLSAIQVISNLFMARELGLPWLDGVYWSLLVEMKFYIFMALLVVFFKDIEKLVLYFALFTIVISSMHLLFVMFGMNAPALVFKHVLIAPYLPFFAVGLVFSAYRRKLASGEDASFLKNLLVTVSTLMAVTFFINFASEITMDALAFLALSLAIIWIGHFSTIGEKIIVKCLGWLAPIGLISYSLYLIHNNLGLSLIKNLNLIFNPNISVLITIAIALIVSYEFSRRFENWRRKDIEDVIVRILSKPGLLLSGRTN